MPPCHRQKNIFKIFEKKKIQFRKFGLDSLYEGQLEVNGDEYYEEADAQEKVNKERLSFFLSRSGDPRTDRSGTSFAIFSRP